MSDGTGEVDVARRQRPGGVPEALQKRRGRRGYNAHDVCKWALWASHGVYACVRMCGYNVRAAQGVQSRGHTLTTNHACLGGASARLTAAWYAPRTVFGTPKEASKWSTMSDLWFHGTERWPVFLTPVATQVPMARLGLDGYSCLMTMHAHSSRWPVVLGGTLRIDGVSWILSMPGLRMSTPLKRWRGVIWRGAEGAEGAREGPAQGKEHLEDAHRRDEQPHLGGKGKGWRAWT